MKLGEVLQRVPGLEKRFVYYLEAQGDIRPRRLPKARIARRDYSPEDLRRIGRLWEYYQRGYSLGSARDLVAQETDQVIYLFLPMAPAHWAEALELLRRSERVVEAAAVYGESADLVAKVEASRREDAFPVLHEVFDRGLLSGPPTVRLAREGRLDGQPAAPEGGMLAYVLMKVPAKHVDGILERLREFEGIREAAVIYGETDIIAKLEVPDQPALDELVIRKIQSLPEVEATRTFLAVGGMHWTREADR